MKVDRVARWLHISDLRCPGGDDPSWEQAVSAALTRVDHAAREWGAFDFVIVSGDLTRTGDTDELARAKRLLDEITKRLGVGAQTPFVLAVPGRHDAIKLDNWNDWWTREVSALPDGVTVRRRGEHGDFVATIELRDPGARIGVVGLGVARGEYMPAEAPAGLEERVRALCVDPHAWVRHHHVALVAVNDAGRLADRYGSRSPQGVWNTLVEWGFEVFHTGGFKGAVADPMVLDLGGVMVAQAMSFSGAGEPYEREASVYFPQGGVVVELAADSERPSQLTAWSYTLWRDGSFLRDEDGPARRDPAYRDVIEAPSARALPEGMSAPMERAPKPEESSPEAYSPELVMALLDTVLPDQADFDGFVLDQLRPMYTRFARWMNRRQQTEFLVEETGVEEVVAALRRYLPDTTAERLAALRASGVR